MTGAVTLLHLYALKLWTGTNLTLLKDNCKLTFRKKINKFYSNCFYEILTNRPNRWKNFGHVLVRNCHDRNEVYFCFAKPHTELS